MLVLVRGVQSGAISGRVRKLGFSPPLFAPSPLKEVVTNLRKGRANEDVTEIRKQQQLPGYYHHKWFSGPNLTQKRRIIRLFSSLGGWLPNTGPVPTFWSKSDAASVAALIFGSSTVADPRTAIYFFPLLPQPTISRISSRRLSNLNCRRIDTRNLSPSSSFLSSFSHWH